MDVIDTTAPLITLAPYITTPTNQDITVTATTNEGTLNFTSHTFTANGSFDFVATDEAGNVATQTVTITNIDKVAPVITLAPYITTPTNQDITVTATTNEGTLNVTSHTFTANGSFDFVATDEAGNVTTQTVRIPNIDKVAPVITVTGINPITVAYGSIYADAGATATDDVNGNITANIVTVNPVDTSTAGTYTITYNVVDLAGNHSLEATRTVVVNNKPSSGGGGGGNYWVKPVVTPVLAKVLTNTPVGKVLGATSFTFTKLLKLNSNNNEVKELQKYLNSHGFVIALTSAGSVGNETTKFGHLTKEALIKFQIANKLKGDGIVGPNVRKLLNQ